MAMKAFVTVSLEEEGLTQLKELAQVEFDGQAAGGRVLSEEELKERLADKQMIILEFEPITGKVIEATNLKIIACTRGGPQANIDIPDATRKGIPVLYAPGRNATAVAEIVLCLMVAVARHVARAHHLLKTGHFLGPAGTAADDDRNVVWGVEEGSPYMVFKGLELSGRTLGIVGLGEVGERVAARAKAFEMNLLVYDPYVPEDKITGMGACAVDLETLMKGSDFVTIHCKVTDETKGLIGERQISLMKPTAYLVNTARGVVLEEAALVKALQEKRIAGAALDVFQQEPLPADSPLLQLDNVVLAPHIGGATIDVKRHMTDIIVSDLRRLFSGERPRYCANPEVLGSLYLAP
jgi:D-3-phosphoglycerate dehydrogenase